MLRSSRLITRRPTAPVRPFYLLQREMRFTAR